MPDRRADRRRQEQLKQLRHQEEGQARARRQVQHELGGEEEDGGSPLQAS